jgi:nicotinamide-nucleotide amidase
MHEPSLEAIRRRFAAFNREMTPSNAKQAMFPKGSEVLPNPIGTAPGFLLKLGGAQLFFTPGVPSEMQRMFDQQILPRVAPLAPSTTAQNHLRTFGQTESKIGEMLAGVEESHPGVIIGYRAHFPEIEVKVFAKGKSRAEAQSIADAATREVRARLHEWVYGEGKDDSYPAAVSRVFRNHALTLSIAESCTGGLVGQMLTSIPGSSEFLLLDAVTYSNASKSAVLGVDPELIRAHGAVSVECCTAMVEGVRRVSSSDVALAVTGIAGPTGGTETKPVGLVYIAIASDLGTEVKERKLPGDRHRVQTLASYMALKLATEAAKKLADARTAGKPVG